MEVCEEVLEEVCEELIGGAKCWRFLILLLLANIGPMFCSNLFAEF